MSHDKDPRFLICVVCKSAPESLEEKVRAPSIGQSVNFQEAKQGWAHILVWNLVIQKHFWGSLRLTSQKEIIV